MNDKTKQALELALEALETHVPHVYKDRGYAPITALRQAINAATQLKESSDYVLREQAEVRSTEEQQEPVAYMGTDIEGNPNKFRLNPFWGCVPLYKKPQSIKVWDAEGYDALCQQLEGWKARALKAEQAPPPRKPWVNVTTWRGLTDEERKEIYRQAIYVEGAIRMTEAKLKEKNTGEKA